MQPEDGVSDVTFPGSRGPRRPDSHNLRIVLLGLLSQIDLNSEDCGRKLTSPLR